MVPKRAGKILSAAVWIIAAAAAALLFTGAFIEPNRLTVRRSVLELPGLPGEAEGMKVLLVADTHFGSSFTDRLRRDRIQKRVRELDADICFLLGDYIAVGGLPGWNAMEEEELKAFFSSIKAPLGCYAVLGNHELWYGRKRMIRLLESSGVRMIENRLLKVKGIYIAGIPESGTAPFDRQRFSQMIQGRSPLLLLTHKGKVIKKIDIPPGSITFAADTHGGQVRIPGKCSLSSFLKGTRELPPGLSKQWNKLLYITTGSGGHRWNFRLFCPPEIALVTLKKQKEAEHI